MHPSLSSASLLVGLMALAGCQPPDCPAALAVETGSFVRGRVAAADAKLPNQGPGVEAAEVSLTDAAGRPISGLPRARTDSSGEYLAARVPPGHTYVMAARVPDPAGGETTLKALARPGADPNVFADLSPASTIVTTRVTQGLPGLPGAVAPINYDKAVSLVAAKLAAGVAPPDLDDTKAVVAWLDSRMAEDAELKLAIEAMLPQAAAGEATEPVEAQAMANADTDPLDALRPIY